MNKEQLAKAIYEVSHLTGEFLLRSGQKSSEYFDKYMFTSNPNLLSEIADSMTELIPAETEIIAGLEMGAIPLAAALSLKTGLSAVYVRKSAKEYGTCKLAEGASIKDKYICVIEDVVTTGGQILQSVPLLREMGARVDTVLCVIQRNKNAAQILLEHGLTLRPLFTMEYIHDLVNNSRP